MPPTGNCRAGRGEPPAFLGISVVAEKLVTVFLKQGAILCVLIFFAMP
jgi:hypothetical protein